MKAQHPPFDVMEPQYAGAAAGGFFSSNDAFGQMTETPRRGSHRRAHSDVAPQLPVDDFLLDVDADFFFVDGPSLSEESNSGDGDLFSVVGKPPESGSQVKEEVQPVVAGGVGGSHVRSLSMDAIFLYGLSFRAGIPENGVRTTSGAGMRPRHRRSESVGALPPPMTSLTDGESSSLVGPMKAMTPAEFALIDPKRAKRILSNRHSAARSKQRKIRYTSELERKLQTLQTQATTLSAQLTLLQRDTTSLTAENKELKIRLQTMGQQAQLRDALSETLREELQSLKIAIGQIPPMNGTLFNASASQPNPAFHPGQQQHLSGRLVQHRNVSLPFPNGQPLADQSKQNSTGFIGETGSQYDLQ